MTKDDLPPKPKFTRDISFGQLVQIVVLVAGFAGGYAIIQKQTSDNQRAIVLAAQDRAAIDTRLRVVEVQQARADERFSSIMSLLGRIDSRLERIEQR